MKKSKNSVQGLIGLERFTKYGVKTDKAEIAFFSVEPTNISVLSAANIDVKIHHLNRRLRIHRGSPVHGGHSHLRGLHPQAVLCRRGLPYGLADLGGAAGAGPVHPAERAVFPVYHVASVGAGGRRKAGPPPEMGRRAGPGVRGPEHRCWPAVLWAHGPVPAGHGPVLPVKGRGEICYI